MWRAIGLEPETDDVFIALVEELSTGRIPAAIIAATYLGIAGYVAVVLESPYMACFAMSGSLIGGSKVVLMWRHCRALRHGAWSRPRAARWEAAHAVLTAAFAAHIGLVTARALSSDDASLHVLATALLFGYCSGIVTRTAFRPAISVLALGIAAIPGSLAAAAHGDRADMALGLMFLVFLLGGVETIRYLYGNARRQITLRLDMATLARNDPLTGSLNRLGLREAFRGVVAGGRGSVVAVHCLDLDGFKPVNDRYGHAAGDRVLVEIARRLRAVVGEAGAVARTGGDEFVVVQGPVAKPELALGLVSRLRQAVREPIVLDGHDIRVGVSIGSATAPPQTPKLEALILLADEALYREKRREGRARPEPKGADCDRRRTLRPLPP